MRLLAALTASALCSLVLLAGCGDDDNSSTPGGGTVNPGADAGPVGPGGGGGHAQWAKATNIEHYKVFPDRAAAIAWFNTADVLRGETGASTDTAVAATDARYADLDKKVEEIFIGYRDAFAEDTKDLPTPIVVLVESAQPGAYAVWDPALKLQPNVFMIQTPTLALGDEALRGVIAHELAHHVLKHKWPDHADAIEVWYDATKVSGNGFGFDQANDANIAKIGKTAQLYGLSNGDYPLTQWNGFIRPGGLLEGFAGYIHDEAVKTNAAACTEADTAREALLTFADPLRDRATNTLTATPDQLTQIDTLSKAFIAKETACTSVVPGKFFKVVGDAVGESEANVRAGSSDIEIEANDSSEKAFEAIVKIGKKYDEYMTTTDLKNVRYYSYEEQADDTAMAILQSIAFPMNGMRTYLEKGALDDAGRAKCASFGDAEPPYGIISDAHHSNCWRIWHSKKLEAFLNE